MRKATILVKIVPYNITKVNAIKHIAHLIDREILLTKSIKKYCKKY